MLETMAIESMSSIVPESLRTFFTSQESSVFSMSLFLTILCTCIVISHWLDKNWWLNESVTALIIGLCSGVLVLLTTGRRGPRILLFNDDLFFHYLLPPIILNAGFKLRTNDFSSNLISIMLLGVVGTFISFGVISLGSMHIFQKMGVGPLKFVDYLAIGAIFSATDSVCTLQVLDQDEMPLLHSLVFGEGIINDATSIVLFKAIQKFNLTHIDSVVTMALIGSFLYLFVASTLLGVSAGLLCAYVTKKLYSKRHSTNREVALMILVAYLSYVLAELLDLSAILTVFFCGVFMSCYGWHNLSSSSRITTRQTFATLSFVAEIFIFLYIGMDALDIEKWKMVSNSPGTPIGAGLVLLALVLIGRAASVFPLVFLSNLTKDYPFDKIDLKQQVTIWWAGLMRGAVSMALAYKQFTCSGHTNLQGNAVMITSTITVVLFSTLVFGFITKPLVKLLNPFSKSASPFSSEPSSPKSLTELLLGDDMEDPEILTSPTNIPRLTSLGMLLNFPFNVIQYWKRFDEQFMRPIFCGVRAVPIVPDFED